LWKIYSEKLLSTRYTCQGRNQSARLWNKYWQEFDALAGSGNCKLNGKSMNKN